MLELVDNFDWIDWNSGIWTKLSTHFTAFKLLSPVKNQHHFVLVIQQTNAQNAPKPKSRPPAFYLQKWPLSVQSLKLPYFIKRRLQSGVVVNCLFIKNTDKDVK